MSAARDNSEADTPGQARSERFRQQFFKTQLCQFYSKGRCHRNKLCPYAHGEDELREAPDLCKTALCAKGKDCQDPNCRFAHHGKELRATDEFLKKDPCKYMIKNGRCFLGKNCRYSHAPDLHLAGQQDRAAGQQDRAQGPQASSTDPTPGRKELAGQQRQARGSLTSPADSSEVVMQGHEEFAGQQHQAQGSLTSSADPSQAHIEFADGFSDGLSFGQSMPRKARSFQGRRMHYAAPMGTPLLEGDGIAAPEAPPRAFRLPPAPPLPEDSLPPLTRLRQTAPPIHQGHDLSFGPHFYENANRTHYGGDKHFQAYHDPQSFGKSAGFSKERLSDDQTPTGYFGGGGLSGAHFEESSCSSGMPDSRVPSGPFPFEDASTVHGSMGLQYGHGPESSALRPTSASVALPAGVARTPQGSAPMTFWL
eukprot:TRINITY_DN88613_c0_g1_i1.p1 TRINITY_DN88613_c0_g1~~TRINITY_DN88613_c0_g1_i1.p1  ORF type:complete len:423 (+),score=33.59 TRINITY_DN88613_c0_g1_i1:66-1334(+)